jgi:AcrR family transcriptional regulator
VPDVRSRRSATRRDELIDAAVRRFAAGGVTATSVDDIVRDAGAAKGTFYLYFTSKDEIVTAVAERLVARVGERMAELVGDTGLPVADRIRGISAAMAIVTPDSYEADLIAEIHRPENLPIHNRLAAPIMTRLLPLVRDAIAEGIRDGTFADQDPDLAAAFALASYAALDALVDGPETLARASAALDAFVLRGLGYRGGPA